MLDKQRRKAGREGEVKRESSYKEQLRTLDTTIHPQGDVSNQHLSKDVAVTIVMLTFHVIPNQYLTTFKTTKEFVCENNLSKVK